MRLAIPMLCGVFVCYAMSGSAMAQTRGADAPSRHLSPAGVLGRIAGLKPSERTAALKRLLTSPDEIEVLSADDSDSFVSALLDYESDLRPNVRALLGDAEAGDMAAWWLSVIAEPADFPLLLQSVTAGGDDEHRAYSVLSALVQPPGEEAWALLRKAANGGFGRGWAVRGAVRSLRLNASERSRTLLEKARRLNPAEAAQIDAALAYIGSKPSPPEGDNLRALAERVARAARVGEWEGNGLPRISRSGCSAFVRIDYRGVGDAYTYGAVFRRGGPLWRLAWFAEIQQRLMPPPPAAK